MNDFENDNLNMFMMKDFTMLPSIAIDVLPESKEDIMVLMKHNIITPKDEIKENLSMDFSFAKEVIDDESYDMSKYQFNFDELKKFFEINYVIR